MACLALTALPCQALDFGRTHVNSALGEPLDAHVRIRLESGEHIDDSCLSVGNQDDFPDADHVLITDARLSLLTSRNAIRISTTKPLDLPAISMALRVRCANGQLTVRALNLYLNPPTEIYSTDIVSSLPGTSITVQPGDSVYGLARTIFPPILLMPRCPSMSLDSPTTRSPWSRSAIPESKALISSTATC